MTARQVGEEILRVEGLVIVARGEGGSGPTLVDHIGFSLRRGQVVGLIGESGAGKSTIGLAALGYTRAGCSMTGGRIAFRGRDIMTMDAAARRAMRGPAIAYIAQSAAASFNPAMTVMQQVCEVPLRQGLMTPAQARTRAIALFRELDLPNPERFGERYPHQVSGGQLQRAMAAMAMAATPDILVFDEPTTALDVTTQVEVLASFRRLIREHGTAAIYITHDLAVVAQIADEIMVLRHGRMVEFGPASQILQAPQQDYTRRLVAERGQGGTGLPALGNQAPPVLSLRGVSASYAGLLRVIDDVSLEVRRGETLAVVGESGSGKSTLARVIVGLLPRQAGEIDFQGSPLPPSRSQRSRDQLRRVQMIYQIPDIALNPRQTVLQIVGRPVGFYFGRSARDIRTRVAELLRVMELPDNVIDRRPGELSGGQKQRIGIARALAAEPDLIICDEVTSALDQLVGEEILRLLRRLQDELGIAYLFITHDLGTVRRIAHRVAVMRRGAIVASGETASVFAPPMHPYTELLLSSVPEMRADWLDDVLVTRKTASRPDQELVRPA